jgi:hypothetical protein
MAEDILRRRQMALNGMDSPEIAKRRESYRSSVQSGSQSALDDLARRQASQGVTGGIAFAQQRGIQDAAARANVAGERDIYLDDLTRRRQALGDYESTMGRERFGGISTRLGERQLNIQEQAGAEERELLKELIRRIAGDPSSGTVQGGITGGWGGDSPYSAYNIPGVLDVIPGRGMDNLSTPTADQIAAANAAYPQTSVYAPVVSNQNDPNQTAGYYSPVVY